MSPADTTQIIGAIPPYVDIALTLPKLEDTLGESL